MIKNDRGYIIETVLVFMLITLGFCMLATTFIGTMNVERRIAKQAVDMQTDLNQVGEYYLRYIEQGGGKFPTGAETDVNAFSGEDFSWMDDEAKDFFVQFNEANHLSFEPFFAISRNGVLQFFTENCVWRKLVVRYGDDDIKMLIELRETRDEYVRESKTYGKVQYDIYNWAIGDHLTDESASGDYIEDNLSYLERLWKILGLLLHGDFSGALRETIALVQDIERDIITLAENLRAARREWVKNILEQLLRL